MKFLVVMFSLLSVFFPVNTHAESSNIVKNIQGKWKEKDGRSVFFFLKEHEFRHYNPLSKEGRKDVWNYSNELCWVGSGKTKGNLMILVGNTKCCFSAYFLGKNLILSSFSSSIYRRICNDNVLIKIIKK